MRKISAAFILLVTAFSMIACPVQAQSPIKGYSKYSTGYMPNTPPVEQSVTTTTKSSPKKDQVLLVAKPSAKIEKTTYATTAQWRDVSQTAFEETGSIVKSLDHSQMGCEDCCGEADDGCLATCCPEACCQPRFWVRAEYLAWWKQGMDLPALVTTNPSAVPTLANSNTVILFGDDAVNEDAKSGGRYTLGMWLDPCHTHSIDFVYLHLGAETTSYYASGSDYTILGRPFFNIETAAADAHLIDYPSTHSGWVSVSAETKFQGTELLWRTTKRFSCSQVHFMTGWRWLQLKDDLLIRESVTDAQSSTIDLSDRFNTKNNFHGVELGFQWEQPLSYAWTFEVLGKFALGNSHSVVTIAGQQTSVPDQGLLALDSNSGTHTRDSFAAITEIGLSVRRQFQCGLEASFGYTLIYWSDVMRAGDQIDLNVDPRQVPPNPQSATHPAVLMSTTDFWTQGLQFGLEYAF